VLTAGLATLDHLRVCSARAIVCYLGLELAECRQVVRQAQTVEVMGLHGATKREWNGNAKAFILGNRT